MKSHDTEINREYSATENAPVTPEPDDEGKDVVDAGRRDIGMVTDVYDDTLYVDPNTSLTPTVKRKLGWHDKRRSDLPVPPEYVTHIDDQVVLAVDRNERSQPEVR